MATLGLCPFCGRPALHTCFRCGLAVCTAHYDGKTGACSRCASGRHAPRHRRGPR